MFLTASKTESNPNHNPKPKPNRCFSKCCHFHNIQTFDTTTTAAATAATKRKGKKSDWDRKTQQKNTTWTAGGKKHTHTLTQKTKYNNIKYVILYWIWFSTQLNFSVYINAADSYKWYVTRSLSMLLHSQHSVSDIFVYFFSSMDAAFYSSFFFSLFCRNNVYNSRNGSVFFSLKIFIIFIGISSKLIPFVKQNLSRDGEQNKANIEIFIRTKLINGWFYNHSCILWLRSMYEWAYLLLCRWVRWFCY